MPVLSLPGRLLVVDWAGEGVERPKLMYPSTGLVSDSEFVIALPLVSCVTLGKSLPL